MKPGTTKRPPAIDRFRRAGARRERGRRADGDDAIAGDGDRLGFCCAVLPVQMRPLTSASVTTEPRESEDELGVVHAVSATSAIGRMAVRYIALVILDRIHKPRMSGSE